MAKHLLTTTTATALLVLTLSNFLLPALSCPVCPVCPNQSPPPPPPKPKTKPPPPPVVQSPPPPHKPKPPPSPPKSPPTSPPKSPPTSPPKSPPTSPPKSPPTSPPPTSPAQCPINVLKLDGCVDVLGGLLHVVLGGSSAKEECCPVLAGLAGADAGLCLCTAIRAKLLNVDLLLPVVLDVLIDCGKRLPADYTCPSTN